MDNRLKEIVDNFDSLENRSGRALPISLHHVRQVLH